MESCEVLVHYVLIAGDDLQEGNLFLHTPLSQAYLQEQMQRLKEQTHCEAIVIRNIVYLK